MNARGTETRPASSSRHRRGRLPTSSAISFAVTNGKERSAIWSCFPDRRPDSNDFYLTCREFSGAVKISFHASGICRAAYEKPFWEREQGESTTNDRVIDRWNIPPIIPTVNTSVFLLYVSPDSLTVPLSPIEMQPYWIPNSLPGRSVAVEVFVAAPPIEREIRVARNISLIGKFPLPNGSQVSVAHYQADGVSPEHDIDVIKAAKKLRTPLPYVGDRRMRSVQFGANAEGKHFVTERSYSDDYIHRFAAAAGIDPVELL